MFTDEREEGKEAEFFKDFIRCSFELGITGPFLAMLVEHMDFEIRTSSSTIVLLKSELFELPVSVQCRQSRELFNCCSAERT